MTPEHVESVYVGLAATGVGAETISSVHRSLRSCFGEAVRRRGRLERNPVLVARPHRVEHREIMPLSLGETRAVLATAAGQRNSVRWMIALALGLRQGEALGLQWDDIDLERGTLSVRRALQRTSWRHAVRARPAVALSRSSVPGSMVGDPSRRPGATERDGAKPDGSIGPTASALLRGGSSR